MTTDTTPAPVTTTGVDRRSVVRTAAWSLPVIAVSAQAPAFAASCNQQYAGNLNLATMYTRNSRTSGTAVVPLANGAGSVTIGFASSTTTLYGAQTGNFTIDPAVGGTNQAGILFSYSNDNVDGSSAQNYKVTLTFSRAVTDLTFLITDIDVGGRHDERLAVISPATFTRNIPANSNCRGAATLANPIYNSVPGAISNINDDSGNVRINVPGPTTTVTLQLWNADTAATGSNDYLTDLSFQAYADGCP